VVKRYKIPVIRYISSGHVIHSRYCIVHLKVKIVQLKSSHHKNKYCNYVRSWMLTYCDDHFAIYTCTKSSCCKPETNIKLYV